MPPGVYPRTVKSPEQRIRDGIVTTPSGCWEWQRRVQPNGYGMLAIGRRSLGEKRQVYAHRLAYETFVGSIPPGRELDHLCRNRRCCNPQHLEPVTRQANILRGDGPAKLGAINGTKAHCKRGHPFDAQNTRLRPGGGRSCRACAREAARSRAKRRANVAD